LLSPVTSIIQEILKEPGSHVNKGDVIMRLNTDNVKNDIEKLRDQLEVKRNNLEKTQLNAQSIRLDLSYNEEVKKLKITSLKSQLADQEQLLDVGGISPARIEETKQQITLAEKDLETVNEKNSIRLKQLETEEEGLLLQIRIQEKDLENKLAFLDKMNIEAPSSGTILSISGHAGEKVGGDQTLVRMSDLSSFKIIGSVEEQFAEKIKTGELVLVTIDGEKLEGLIGNITPRVENNKIQFNVHLKEDNHSKLIANQQVQIQIVSNHLDNVVRIPRNEDFEKARQQKLFVVAGNTAIKKEVTLGTIGDEYCEVLSGLETGDVVITSGINAFRHLTEIEIENK
jgi:HlyD family secretion protein